MKRILIELEVKGGAMFPLGEDMVTTTDQQVADYTMNFIRDDLGYALKDAFTWKGFELNIVKCKIGRPKK